MKKTPKKKKTVKPTKKHEIVVRIETPAPAVPTAADLAPEKEGSKYMLPKSWISERQVLRMVQQTPPQHVYTRPAKGGGTWSYVTGTYVEKVLNFTFGWNWDFEVMSHGKEGEQVWVLGRLTVKDDHGHAITKTQFGRADLKFKRDTKITLDFGNDLKAAATDSLKKCASLLGIASDVYGKAEFKHEVGREISTDVSNLAAPKVAIGLPKASPDAIRCQKCMCEVGSAEASYSQRRFGKILCRADQPTKNAR